MATFVKTFVPTETRLVQLRDEAQEIAMRLGASLTYGDLRCKDGEIRFGWVCEGALTYSGMTDKTSDDISTQAEGWLVGLFLQCRYSLAAAEKKA